MLLQNQPNVMKTELLLYQNKNLHQNPVIRMFNCMKKFIRKKLIFFLFSTVFELPFYDKKIPRGFYTIHLTLQPQTDGKFIGLTDNTVRRPSCSTT